MKRIPIELIEALPKLIKNKCKEVDFVYLKTCQVELDVLEEKGWPTIYKIQFWPDGLYNESALFYVDSNLKQI